MSERRENIIEVARQGVLAGELRPRRRFLEGLGSFLRKKPLGAASLFIILVMAIMAIFANVIAPYPPFDPHPDFPLVRPFNPQFLLGTDQLGRDVLSRIMLGARVSLWVGFMAVAIGTLSGVAVGTVSGYFGGWLDMVLQRMVDALLSIPLIVLALAIVTVLRPSINNVMLALGIVLMPRVSRIVRGTVISVRENQYIEAARAIGARDMRVLLRHVLPNSFAPIIVIASIDFGQAIIAEATLSFLGVGVPPPFVSWGEMLSGEGRQIMEEAPYMALIPGIAISLAVLAFNLLGDSLRDVLDPRLKT